MVGNPSLWQHCPQTRELLDRKAERYCQYARDFFFTFSFRELFWYCVPRCSNYYLCCLFALVTNTKLFEVSLHKNVQRNHHFIILLYIVITRFVKNKWNLTMHSAKFSDIPQKLSQSPDTRAANLTWLPTLPVIALLSLPFLCFIWFSLEVSIFPLNQLS